MEERPGTQAARVHVQAANTEIAGGQAAKQRPVTHALNATGQALAYVYGRDKQADADGAHNGRGAGRNL